MEPLLLAIALWIGFAAGITFGLIVSGALDRRTPLD
jgi:hypothetical protein